MKKIVNLSESDLYRITKRVIKEREEQELEQELDEIVRFNLPVGTKLGNIYQGIKGFVKGESYGYFNYLSKIKNRSKRVMNELEHIETFVKYLTDLKPKIEKLKIAPEKKLRLLTLVNKVINNWQPFFPQFVNTIKEINKLSHEKLSGERLDVVPGLNPNEIGSDLMEPKVKPVDLSDDSSKSSGSSSNSTSGMGNSKSTNTGSGSNSTSGQDSSSSFEFGKSGNNFNINNDSNIEDIDYVEVDDEDDDEDDDTTNEKSKDDAGIEDKDLNKPLQEEIKRFRQIIRY